MAEIEKQPQEEIPPVETAPAGSPFNIKIILLGAGVFVVFIIIFSLVMGVFSSSPQPKTTEQPADSTKPIVADTITPEYDPYSLASQDEGGDTSTSASDSTADSTMSAVDSVAQVLWYEAQKEDIQAQRIQLQSERAELEQLKMMTQSLIQERKNIEQANLTAMAKLLEAMKPEEVAAIMANMPDTKVGMLLHQMKSQSASQIMAKLPSERAAKITMQMIDLAEGK